MDNFMFILLVLDVLRKGSNCMCHSSRHLFEPFIALDVCAQESLVLETR